MKNLGNGFKHRPEKGQPATKRKKTCEEKREDQTISGTKSLGAGVQGGPAVPKKNVPNGATVKNVNPG